MSIIYTRNRNVRGLERHAYAPELNRLHLVDGTEICVPRCTDIDSAVEYVQNIERQGKPLVVHATNVLPYMMN